jgi:F420H(2)-dependent quinone reductase
LTERSGEIATARPAPRMPPRWFIRAAWIGHRAIHRFTGGRRGLAHPKPGDHVGYLRLKSIGRRSGEPRAAILAYIEDGPNLVTLAMNGWGNGDPAWWLNLQAQPDATVELKGATSRAVRARAAAGGERERLWAIVDEYTGYGDDLDAFAALRSSETAVVVLEPRSSRGS